MISVMKPESVTFGKQVLIDVIIECIQQEIMNRNRIVSCAEGIGEYRKLVVSQPLAKLIGKTGTSRPMGCVGEQFISVRNEFILFLDSFGIGLKVTTIRLTEFYLLRNYE